MLATHSNSTLVDQIRLLSDKNNIKKIEDNITITEKAKEETRDALKHEIKKINFSNESLKIINSPKLAIPDGSQYTVELIGSEFGTIVTVDSTNKNFVLSDSIHLPISNDNNKVKNFIREFQENRAIDASKAEIICKDGSLLQFLDSVKNIGNLNTSQSKHILEFLIKYYGDNPNDLIKNSINLVINPAVIGVAKRSGSKQVIHKLGIRELIDKGINDKQLFDAILEEDEIITFSSTGHYSKHVNLDYSFIENKSLINFSKAVKEVTEVAHVFSKSEYKIHVSYFKSKASSPVIRLETKLNTLQDTKFFKRILLAVKLNTQPPIKELVPGFISDFQAKNLAYKLTCITHSKLRKNWKGDIQEISKYRSS